ncbi:reverse transcriptase domain-containing protein [Streptomyces sp. NBC_00120]|uniref:reverse transcriptase domain-containing protein n=1 Tax=Streptomyces sp. NBC_00120 TaxID=2975660 RepID=UPI0022554A74|nr:reverse transcriptase domain-containing protein [Streptomyces sp. NBC_00120]MCX5323848.1 reverse transcriptase/maturase family protein [Streptomyces sp. NBC_00120]
MALPWDLLVKAVGAHTDAVWVKLYVRRWLAAPLVMPDGSLLHRERGTPQGAPVSPVMANLFLHYAFDMWMDREFPAVQFERYADDAVIHCVTERQAREVLDALQKRMVETGLELHPDKTRIVYCKDDKRRGSYEHEAFTFLGYTFRARKGRDRRGVQFLSFTPAVSKEALKKMGREAGALRDEDWSGFAGLAG